MINLFALILVAAGQSTAAKPASVPAAKVVAKDSGPVQVDLRIDPSALNLDADRKLMLPYYPSGVELVAERPAGLVKEPLYAGKPKYGALRLGNGPRSTIYFAIDEPEGKPGRIYLDVNGNGDLTDDGSPEWGKTIDDHGVTNYEKELTVRASWGDAIKETSSTNYGILIYMQRGASRVGYTRIAARTGSVTIGGKSYNVLLAENQSDALYTIARKGDSTRKPVWLIFNPDSNKRILADLSEPFNLDGKWYEAFPSVSGDKLTVRSSVAPDPKAPALHTGPRVALLKEGANAPDFTVLTPDGKPESLSQFRGKTVILDFWATWCGPCQVSMPGLEKIYRQVRDKNVVVLSVNVFDDKAPFDQWIAKNAGTNYSFTFGYDPAGRNSDKSVAASKFGVTGIPTLFIIDKDGKIANVVVGSGNEKKIAEDLTKLGTPATAPTNVATN